MSEVTSEARRIEELEAQAMANRRYLHTLGGIIDTEVAAKKELEYKVKTMQDLALAAAEGQEKLRARVAMLKALLEEWKEHGQSEPLSDDAGWRLCPICDGDDDTEEPLGDIEHEPTCLLMRTRQAVEEGQP